MDKQLTPLQKAIEWLNSNERFLTQWIDKQPDEKDITTQTLKLEMIRTFRKHIQSLLTEEKQFAENAFNKARERKAVGTWQTELFDDFYKQYEDEK